jgi:divalent metal cation (Fe/Co/Zn/Cd) transporter
MDSFLDLFSIGFTTMAVRMSVTPADDEHPFGHGKIEGISALIQAFLVLVAGAFIIYSSIERIIHRTTISPDTGIIVMIISSLPVSGSRSTCIGLQKRQIRPQSKHLPA